MARFPNEKPSPLTGEGWVGVWAKTQDAPIRSKEIML